MSPKYSRSYINRIGDTLLSDSCAPEEYENALQVFSDWRALHLTPLKTFQTRLRNYVNKVDPKGIVAQRLKRTSTIIDKLKNRQTHMELGRMQDVGGLRAIVNNVQDVRKIESKFDTSHVKHVLRKKYDYITDPKGSGYRGIHLVYEYNNSEAPDYDGLLIEIQLRSKLQHLWATAVETAGFFFQESLKSSSGDVHRLEFFRLTSALFSHEEQLPANESLRHLQQKEIVEQFRQYESEHGILSQLNAIQLAQEIKKHTLLKEAIYWVIETTLDPPAVRVYPFLDPQRDTANRFYKQMESSKMCQSGKSQVVLVAVDSVKKLEKAYPNYFLDIKEFIAKTKKYLK